MVTLDQLSNSLNPSFLLHWSPMPATGPPPTKGEQTRQAILAAAVERFGRDGYRSTSVADIARDAGVGGTVAYAYFASKEALFLAAIDEDAAGAIHEGLINVVGSRSHDDWQQAILVHMVAALGHHPLARRVLAGLEPEVTDRVLEMPALAELRKVMAARLAEDQLAGLVRADIDPHVMANGVVAIVLSLLMSVVQLGTSTASPYAADVSAVFGAALDPVPPPGD
jgi:AcrR family transcriptional regulator